MSRWVVPKTPGLRKGELYSPQEDNALGRIVKYIPAEVLVAYTMLLTTVLALDVTAEERQYAAFGLIILFLVATLFYIIRHAPSGNVQKAHCLVSPLAFLAWAYPISSSAIGDAFFPLLAFALQAVTIVFSIFIQPIEE